MTPADFQTAFPGFADVDVTVVQRWLTAADPWFDVGRWDAFYTQGLGFWVAHQLIMEAALSGKACGGVGFNDKIGELAALPIIMKTVDTVSITYSANLLMKQVEDPFLRTFYGQQYRYLANLVGIGMLAV